MAEGEERAPNSLCRWIRKVKCGGNRRLNTAGDRELLSEKLHSNRLILFTYCAICRCAG